MNRVSSFSGHDTAVGRSGSPPEPVTRFSRLRNLATGALGAIVGLVPHVLHHVGFLVGTAFVAGTGGTLLFLVIGLIASIPTLRRLHRRFGSLWAPTLALALFALMFTISAFVVGPALSGVGEGPAPPADQTDPGHDGHHG